ncbi:mediator of RNA polymerase II transcription subunit 15 [Contarinia nasturtii]|uniref:mediator of RNA polymerase II transcription subunit 15 n=1 Tax=Contarinia nasturtii TaxID=265458 RepID=UPI0012D3A9EF|nr:mediator of RNA polymerase II transcription subunit 15 [Contarinia nasturtii]
MDNSSVDWRSPTYRQNVVEKINEALQNVGIMKSASEMENQVFQKASSHDEYRNMVAKIVLHMQSQKNKKQQSETMDPINALQHLTNQGTRNPMPGQMMAMGGNQMQMGNNTNPNALQNLINQRAGQAQMQSMPNIRGAVPNSMANTMGNAMPNAINAMNSNNMNMNMGTSNQPNQIAGNNMVGQMNQMQMNQLQTGQMNSMNNMNIPMNINPTMPQNQMNASNLNQQINPNQMSQMLNRINSVQNIVQQNSSNVGNQMNQAQMTQINAQMMSNPNMPSNINQPNVVSNVQSVQNAPPNVSTGPNVSVPNVSVPNTSGGPAQLQAANQMNQMNQMINMPHMARNQPANLYQGIRNPTPNQSFFRKSPSPSIPSPMGNSLPNQMVPSPLVPSPQVVPNIMSQRTVMAPSPSNTNLNTPGQANAAPSPLNPQEEHLYREKYRQLTKYIEPLKKMMNRMGSDDEKLLKMNKLLEILCNPNQRIPLETLIKCEAALEKMDLKSYSMASNATNFPSGSKEHNVNNALLDAVSANLQSPIGNHTLQRTFRPCIESLFGPDIKNLPQTKYARTSSNDTKQISNTSNEVPHVLQGEIARLDRKFKITLDSSVQSGSKILKLICYLNDDPYLPCIPPLYIDIPEDYPETSPSCTLLDEMSATQFLDSIQKIFSARMLKMPSLYSLSHILDTWEMSIRQACSPNNNNSSINSITSTSVALGV